MTLVTVWIVTALLLAVLRHSFFQCGLAFSIIDQKKDWLATLVILNDLSLLCHMFLLKGLKLIKIEAEMYVQIPYKVKLRVIYR